MSGSIGGHTNVARGVVPPSALPKLGIAEVGTPCTTESFDTPDTSTIGPDQPWISTDFNSSSTSTAHVRGQALTFAAAAGSTTGRMWLRCETDCGFADMSTSATITALGPIGTGTGEFVEARYGVMARMKSFPGDGGGNAADPTSFDAGNFVAWWFEVSQDNADSYADLSFAYYDTGGTSFTSISAGATIVSGQVLANPLAAGDTITVAVSGTGASTHVVCSINGVSVIDADGATIVGVLGGTTELSDAMNNSGQRGGLTLGGIRSGATWASANDDVLRLDDFEVCPA